MKKILIFLVMVSVLIGVMGIISAVPTPVATMDGSATVNVIGGTVNVSISPLLITFGDLLPGTIKSNATSGILNISASTTNASNANIGINVAVSGVLFQSNLFFNDSLANGMTINMPCIGLEVCTYTDVILMPKLTVPYGTQIGFQTGTITYTINGQPPA